MESSIIMDLLIGAVLRGSLYILMAMGLSLVFGVMKISNFAHGEFYMIGAYFCYYALDVWKLNPAVAILFSALGGFLVGAIIERLTFYYLRKRSQKDWALNTFLLTAGISIMLINLAQVFMGTQFKGVSQMWAGSIAIGGFNVSMDRVVAFLVAMATLGMFWLFMKKTRTGNAIWAVSEHETGAMLMGINLARIHTLTFGISAMLASIAGAALLSIIPAYPSMGLQPLYKSWFVVILVGLGNLEATIFGGIALGIMESLITFKMGPGWQDVLTFTLIIIVLLFKPSGLFGKKLKV